MKDGATVRAKDLTLAYRKTTPVVRNFSADFFPGMTVLAGSNGSGKSTVLKSLAGHLLPLQGEVEILGKSAYCAKARGLRTVAPSSPGLVPSLTVRDHAHLAKRAINAPLAAIMQRLDDYELTDWIDAPCGELSSRNKQRTWWALSTVVQRPVMLIDEPFTAVDAEGVRLMVRELNAWSLSGESTIIIVAHEPPGELLPTATIEILEGVKVG